MGLQSSRYKEQMYNYWIIIWEDGKRFPPPRITRLKGKIRWDDDRTQYFSFPNIQWFPTNTIIIIEVILQSDQDVNRNHVQQDFHVLQGTSRSSLPLNCIAAIAISVCQSIGGRGISMSWVLGLLGLVTTGEVATPGGPYMRSRFNLRGVR